MKFYFVRHGESEANLLHVMSNRDLPHALTDRGREQAHELAARFRDISIAYVYSSPVARAVETATIVGETLGRPVVVTDALREYDCGVCEGRGDDAAWAEYTRIEASWCDGRLEDKIEGGESVQDMRARFVPFVEELRSLHIEDGVVLVGHGGLYRHVLPAVLDNISTEFARDHGLGYTDCVIASDTDNGLTCLEWRHSSV